MQHSWNTPLKRLYSAFKLALFQSETENRLSWGESPGSVARFQSTEEPTDQPCMYLYTPLMIGYTTYLDIVPHVAHPDTRTSHDRGYATYPDTSYLSR